MPGEERIRVAVRAKPYATPSSGAGAAIRDDRGDLGSIAATPDGAGVLVFADDAHTKAASFLCDAFLPPTMGQDDVFDAIHGHELVEAALDGFPVTIFAYGQTGAGKSFTIFGKEDGRTERKRSAQATDGVLPRAAIELMRLVDARRADVAYTLRVTCVEIYNETVKDVFDPRKESLAVRAAKDPNGSGGAFYLENATVVQCESAAEMVHVVKTAAANRTKSSHLLNERSNRSHCIVTIYIDALPLAPSSDDGSSRSAAVRTYGKLTVVDLAGSERANDTGAVGVQLKETGHINRSLYTLNQVIQALSSKAKAKFVPVRDSKLTMLLVDSLGGNSKTLMIACVNAAPQFRTESTRTLEFAMGVAKIKNHPTAVLSPHLVNDGAVLEQEKLILDLKEQIRLLRLENMMLRSRTPGYFVEHPEFVSPEDGGRQQYQQQSDGHGPFSPLSKALLTGRRASGNQGMHNNNNNQHRSSSSGVGARLDTALASAKRHSKSSDGEAAAQRSLRTLKKKVQPDKQRKSQAATSPTKQQQLVRKRSHGVVAESVALPPVRQFLVPPRSLSPASSPALTASAQRPSVRYTPNVTVARPASPPPDYDDLFFGIETVAIPAARDEHVRSKPLLTPLAATQQHEQRVVYSRVPSSYELSAEETLQRLLQQMVPQQPASTRHTSKSKSTTSLQQSMLQPNALVTRAHAAPTLGNASANVSASASLQWDDDRAQQLFQQLCSLK